MALSTSIDPPCAVIDIHGELGFIRQSGLDRQAPGSTVLRLRGRWSACVKVVLREPHSNFAISSGPEPNSTKNARRGGGTSIVWTGRLSTTAIDPSVNHSPSR